MIELDGFSDRKLYIFVDHISAIMKNEEGKGTKIYIDSSEIPFTVQDDIENVLEKIIRRFGVLNMG